MGEEHKDKGAIHERGAEAYQIDWSRKIARFPAYLQMIIVLKLYTYIIYCNIRKFKYNFFKIRISSYFQ